MAQVKNTFLKSKMNKDLDSRIIGNGEYRDAQNASVSASEDASVGSLENIRGNQLLSLLGVDFFNNSNIEVIGQYSDVANNRMFFFLTGYSDSSIDSLSNTSEESESSPSLEPGTIAPGNYVYYSFDKNAADHYICYCQLPNSRSSSDIDLTNVKTKILVSGSFLNFSKTSPILGINVIENLLFWTDNRNQPRKINVETAILNSFVSTTEPGYYYNEDHISVAKYSPYSAISFVKNFNGVDECTLTNEIDEWLPPFFAAPAYKQTGTVTPLADYLQFDATNTPIEDLYSYVWRFVYGGSVNPPTANNGVKIQPAYDTSADHAFFRYAGAYNATDTNIGDGPQQVQVQNSSGDRITDFSTTLSGWPDTATVYNFSIKNPNYNVNFLGDKKFLEDKFARFSYRFKYEDNEYSLTAPFSQHAFVPKQFGYFLSGDDNRTKDSSTVDFMENQITTAQLIMDLPFAPNEIVDKLKVKEIQILYKSSDDQNVKIIQDIDITNTNLQLGCPKSYSLVNAGSGYSPGSYKQVPVSYSNGTGTGALADLVVDSAGTVRQILPNYPLTVSTGSLITGEVTGLNLTNTIQNAGINMTNILISPVTTGAGPGNYQPFAIRFASFRISTNSTGEVSKVEITNGGGGYKAGDILTFNLFGVLSTSNLSGVLTLNITNSLIAPNMSGENYKAGDILTIPPLPVSQIGRLATFIPGSASDYVIGKEYNLVNASGNVGNGSGATLLCDSITGDGTMQNQGNGGYINGDVLYARNFSAASPAPSYWSRFEYDSEKQPIGTGAEIKVASLTNSFTYKYSSEKPIKVLTNEEVTRVSDIVPMRAQTQESVGNRIVYGNFLQNKSTPLFKYKISTQAKGLGSSKSDLELNNSTLKQGRSYQVGVVLQDRYGRSSNVIINNNSNLNASFFAPYSNAGTNPLNWLGNSLRIIFEDGISSAFSPDGNGFYSEQNPLGWYTYKVVVQQQEQDYYNVYTAGALSGNIIYTTNAKVVPPAAGDPPTGLTIQTPLKYSEENEVFQLALFNDNINKIPRELKEVGDTDNIFSSNVVLYNRVNNSNLDTDSGAENNQNLSTQNKPIDTVKQEVNTVRAFKELGDWTDYKNINLHFLKMDPNPAAVPRSQYSNPTFIYPGTEGEIDPFYLKNNKNPLIATITTKKRMGFSKINQQALNFDFAKNLMVFETEPFKSNLDIYYETSTSGLISELNNDIASGIDPTGEGVIGDIDGVSVTTWLETTQANSVITNEFTAQDLNGNALGSTSSQFLTIEVLNVTTSTNIPVPNPPFECVQSQAAQAPTTPPNFYIRLLPAGVTVYGANSNVDDSYFVTLRATVNEPNTPVQTFDKAITLALSNVEPAIYRIQGFANQTNQAPFNEGENELPIGAYYNRSDILNDYLRANINGDNGYSKIVTAGFPDRTGQLQPNFYAQQMNSAFFETCCPWNIDNGGGGLSLGYISHFTNGFEPLTAGPQVSSTPPSYPGTPDNDSFRFDNTSNEDVSKEMFPRSRLDVQPVIHKVVKYNSYWEGKNSSNYGAQPPTKFAGFVPTGWYDGGVNDPGAQVGANSGLKPRLAHQEFRFVNSGNVDKALVGINGTGVNIQTSKDVMNLQYIGPNGDTFNDRWHDSLNRFWWAAWYYQIQIKIKDAGGATGTLSSETYYLNLLIGNNSRIPK